MEIYLPQVPNTGDSNQNNQTGYTVQPGDTLESIAAQFGVGLDALIAANFSDGVIGQIFAGQEINIPIGENVTGFIGYTTQEGDTKEGVASQFQVGLTDLLCANPSLVKSPLLAGSLLKIPQLTGGIAIASNEQIPDDYTMKLGDSLGEIAKKYGVSTQELQKANPDITDINKSYPGKVIKFLQNKPVQEQNNAQGKDNYAPTLAFDNFSKLRFQMMKPRSLQTEVTPPGFGTIASQVNEREEQDNSQKSQQRPSMPAPFDKWAEFIYLASEKYSLAGSLIAAVIWYESGGNNIVGKNRHGCGLMQIDDRRYPDWVRTHQQGLDPASNIDFGSSILRECLDRFKNDNKLALAAYSV
ncbi:MAG: spore coat assembly protein SafA, partial [bacterium]